MTWPVIWYFPGSPQSQAFDFSFLHQGHYQLISKSCPNHKNMHSPVWGLVPGFIFKTQLTSLFHFLELRIEIAHGCKAGTSVIFQLVVNHPHVCIVWPSKISIVVTGQVGENFLQVMASFKDPDLNCAADQTRRECSFGQALPPFCNVSPSRFNDPYSLSNDSSDQIDMKFVPDTVSFSVYSLEQPIEW